MHDAFGFTLAFAGVIDPPLAIGSISACLLLFLSIFWIWRSSYKRLSAPHLSAKLRQLERRISLSIMIGLTCLFTWLITMVLFLLNVCPPDLIVPIRVVGYLFDFLGLLLLFYAAILRIRLVQSRKK